MSQSLPLRANLEWLKKLSKERLAELRVSKPDAALSEAQFLVAREYGFPSWRRLKFEVDKRQSVLTRMARALADDTAPVPENDPQLIELFKAIKDGDTNTVRGLVLARTALVRAYGPDGQMALHVAAEYNDPTIGTILVACGADPEAKLGESGHTAMSWAVTCNALEFAQTLVKLGGKADLFCAAGIGALDQLRACFAPDGALRPGASRTGSSRYVDGVRQPCPPESPRDQISDALYIAARNGRAEVIRELLTHDPDLAFKAYNGGTALHWAYFSGSRETIDLLIAAGADRNTLDDQVRCTPRAFGICTLASWGFLWLVQKQLAADPSLADVRSADGKRPRDFALANGHEKVAAAFPG